jgi:hypothetical protein
VEHRNYSPFVKSNQPNIITIVGMMLGEAVAGLRIGDIDGYEDTARRKLLDAMGFVWGKFIILISAMILIL